METTALTHLSSSGKLKHRIMHLASLKEDQEEQIKRDLKEIRYSLTPSAIVRSTVKNLNNDDEFRHNAVSETISMGANLLIDTLIFRKGFGIKKFILNAGLKKLVNHFISGKKDGKA